MNLKVLRLTKHFGNNNYGEVASFSPETAAHIMKHNGGELIGEIDPTRQLFVMRDGKGVIVDAEPELGADGKPTGNLVPKAPAKKQPEK